MIQLQNLNKVFVQKDSQFTAVSDVSLNIHQGDVFGIIGFSGAGKSTLLRMINLLERPNSGDIKIQGDSLLQLSKKQLLEQRKSIGMIFQHFNLLTNRTALENIELPLEFSGVSKAERRKRALECLEIVDLLDKKNAFPSQLSGGQKQRIAIARAIVTQPKILLCDEPTSSVDPQTKESILHYLAKINKQFGITIVIVTHEMQLVHKICNRVAVMEHGQVIEEFDLTQPIGQPVKSIISKLLLNDISTSLKEAS
ncbi:MULTISPECIES: methionine ABC transporter ATP-binding protein [Acinetobacter]|uniref:methionine ABC transporter ATP-binding protein n=1 Tax=Acinetobacter TaxID=469 RepID=UPI0015D11691|nr:MULTISPECIES: ATP-binding cassette domain-containing protein [Acinetobacter]MDM1342526.1 ATP-binding cassette domain-containing protein [Acinetobacter pseudolwoffii]